MICYKRYSKFWQPWFPCLWSNGFIICHRLRGPSRTWRRCFGWTSLPIGICEPGWTNRTRRRRWFRSRSSSIWICNDLDSRFRFSRDSRLGDLVSNPSKSDFQTVANTGGRFRFRAILDSSEYIYQTSVFFVEDVLVIEPGGWGYIPSVRLFFVHVSSWS